MRRADAYVSTAGRQIEESWHDYDGTKSEEEEDGILRHRMRVEYLIEAGKHAVHAALYTTEQIDTAITRKEEREQIDAAAVAAGYTSASKVDAQRATGRRATSKAGRVAMASTA